MAAISEDDLQNTELSQEDILLQRHKQERKELQGKIQKIKHGVPKGDKKKKKESQVEIARLEAALDLQQQNELDELKKNPDKKIDGITEQIDRLSAAETTRTDSNPAQKKPSKAQRRRDKKAAQEKEREVRIEEGHVESITGARNIEAVKLKKILRERKLKIHEVPSDGNCLYAALKHQLSTQNVSASVASLRKQAAEHMRLHSEDFLPFLSNHNTGDPYTADEFDKYCDELENTAAWGGQLEIRALSNILQYPIEVLQADAPSIVTGEEYDKQPLLLSYHRHAFGLGEHYNSVIVGLDEEEDEFS